MFEFALKQEQEISCGKVYKYYPSSLPLRLARQTTATINLGEDLNVYVEQFSTINDLEKRELEGKLRDFISRNPHLNESQIGDIWMLFADYIDKKQVEVAAERYIDLLADYGISDKVLQNATGVDNVLDAAIDYYLDEPEEDSGDDDEENDFKELDF
jgi:hypothetical protein